MQNVVTAQRTSNLKRSAKSRTGKKTIHGPSLFEVEYLRQVKEEWELYLRSKSFNTIMSLELVFDGAGYRGSMKVIA